MTRFLFARAAGLFALLLAGPALPAEGTDTPIRDSTPATAVGGDLRRAHLAGETGRYRHFVLGGRFEASRLVATDAEGRVHRLDAPPDAVFEDREARLVDLDGDGRNEIVVVIARAALGASLAVIGLREGGLRVLAETPPIGTPHRWMNPSGFGRFFDGPGRQIALVVTPHLGGRLEIWSFDGVALSRRATRERFSTHRIGSRHQRLYAVLPRADGRGDRLLLPSFERTALILLDFREPAIEVARFPLEGGADGAFRASKGAEGWNVAVPMEGGGTDRVRIPAR